MVRSLKKNEAPLLTELIGTFIPKTDNPTLAPLHFEIQGRFLGERLISTRENADVWNKTLKTLGITKETIKTSYKKQLSITIN